MTPHALLGNVTAQVPAAKNLLFVKLPDRILLIDPDEQQVAEIILNDGDTKPGAGNSVRSPSRDPLAFPAPFGSKLRFLVGGCSRHRCSRLDMIVVVRRRLG